MKIAFTICSNNYLPQARVLRNSLIETNPDYKFFYILVDALDESLNYEADLNDDVIPIDQIQIPNFDELVQKYNIIELNTSVKASSFKYLLNKYPTTEKIFYFDPDIAVFSRLQILENELNQNDIILTPHILKPLSIDLKIPNESVFLNYGIYNLGFIGLKNTSQIRDEFLIWWEQRLLKLCFIDVASGLFVDQLWINLVPIFYPKVKVLDHPGMNVAPWNLHERSIEKIENHYMVNSYFDLIFYHFSTYKVANPNTFFKFYERNYNYFEDNNIKALYSWYKSKILEIDVLVYSTKPCIYIEKEKRQDDYHLDINLNKNNQLIKMIKYILPPIIVDLYKIFKRKISS